MPRVLQSAQATVEWLRDSPVSMHIGHGGYENGAPRGGHRPGHAYLTGVAGLQDFAEHRPSAHNG
ncbi:MAG: hypothetical protein WA142_04600 [Rugosibacter sp.]